MILRPAPARWAAVAALIVMVAGTIGTHHRASPPGPVWLGVLLAAGALVPVLVELPGAPSLLGSGVLTGAYFAAGYADGPVFLALPAVAFTVASTTSRRYWPWAAAAVALALAGLLARDAWHDVDRSTLWPCLGLAALVAATSALGVALRARREAMVQRARSVASEERLRMAADLHDGVGHGLAVIAMQAGAALHVLDRDQGSVRASLEAIRDTSRESLDLLRGQLSLLTGDMTGGKAPPRTPTPGLADLSALVDRVRSGGLDVRLTMEVGEVPEAVGRAVYAVVQEGLTNVLRHAAATRADVSIVPAGGSLLVTVADDGRGADGPAGAITGLGITGMRSRLEDLGGRLEAGPAATGFLVRATVPLREGR
jgi:signal transduction histidine kinase